MMTKVSSYQSNCATDILLKAVFLNLPNLNKTIIWHLQCGFKGFCLFFLILLKWEGCSQDQEHWVTAQ